MSKKDDSKKEKKGPNMEEMEEARKAKDLTEKDIEELDPFGDTGEAKSYNPNAVTGEEIPEQWLDKEGKYDMEDMSNYKKPVEE